MPPKAARGGASRGRGRGRGKATAPAESDVMTGLLGEAPNEPSSQSTLEDSSIPTAKITTPQHLLEDSTAPSPNSSPVSIPTETPAPTPARAPIPRSEPAVTPSITSSSHPGGPSTRGGRGGARGAKPAGGPSRFKPKNVRSDQNKLLEIANKEQEKLNALAAEKAREQARLLRGRGRPARGRGDVMGRRAATASGIFSVAPEALKTNPQFASKSFSGGGGASGIKREAGGPSRSGHSGSGGAGRGVGSGDYNYEPRYPDDDGDAPRIDIEQINIISEDEAEVTITGVRPAPNRNRKSGPSKGGLKPVRLDRHEHKERETVVNTEPATKKEEDSDDDVLMVDEAGSGKAAAQPESSVATFIKYELDDDDVAMPVHGAKPPPSASPDAKRRLQESNAHIPPVELDAIPDVSADAVAKAKKDRKTRELKKKLDKKPVLQTAQDRAEYERHLEDVQILAEELGGMQTQTQPGDKDKGKGKEKDVKGDMDMENSPATEPDKKDGRLYLFQFPPVLPELYNPNKDKPLTPAEVKAKELEEAREKERLAEATKKAEKGKGKAAKPTEPSAEQVEKDIKVEAEAPITPEEKKKREEEEKRNRRQGFVKEEGYIGKLVVRASGRVELCWGGTSLLVGRGVDAGFLTTGVVVDSQERGPPGGGAPEGKAMSMGQIMGKFVVTPDWQKMT